jgi:hypothetical protein
MPVLYSTRAVLYSTDSTHMVCVIVSSIPAISSVAKSIREGYKCTVFQTLAPASSFLVYIHRRLWFIGGGYRDCRDLLWFGRT